MPRTKRDHKSNQSLVVIVAGAIIAAVVGIAFVLMQGTGGENYVRTLQSVSDQSKELTQRYEDAIARWNDGQISVKEMLEITDSQLEKLDGLLTKLKSTEPPEKFRVAHELSILSLTHELESDRHMRNYIETGDKNEYETSAELLQKAFDYETHAFEEFNRAGRNT